MRDSLLEIKIYNILKDAGLPFEEEYEFEGLVGKSGRNLRFDFCIFDNYSVDFSPLRRNCDVTINNKILCQF